jgi:predicted nucleotidyltransferase
MGKDMKDIAERFGCVLIYFFGSQAEKGRSYLEGEEVSPEPFSDLDVAILFKDPPVESVKIYGEVYREISEILEPFHIDLVLIHEMDTLFQYEVIKGVRVYQKDEQATDEFEERIMARAEDLLFKKRILDREIMEAIENGYIEFEYIPGS